MPVSKKVNTIDTTTIDTTTIDRGEGRFKPPTQDEILKYLAETNIRIDHNRFIDFYASKGWMVGKNKMKDWKSAVRNWSRRDRNDKKSGIDRWLDKKKELDNVTDNTSRLLPDI